MHYSEKGSLGLTRLPKDPWNKQGLGTTALEKVTNNTTSNGFFSQSITKTLIVLLRFQLNWRMMRTSFLISRTFSSRASDTVEQPQQLVNISSTGSHDIAIPNCHISLAVSQSFTDLVFIRPLFSFEISDWSLNLCLQQN